jgi:hypothetical protein
VGRENESQIVERKRERERERKGEKKEERNGDRGLGER